MNVPDPAVFDRAALASRLEGDEELVLEIVALFAEDAALQLAKLRAAVGASELRQAARIAHTVKGAAANVSALRIFEVAIRAEQAAEGGDADACLAAVGELQDELRAFKETVRAQGLLRPGASD